MKFQEAEKAVDEALQEMKNDPVGKFKSPMGHGIVIKAAPEYPPMSGEHTTIENHHFLTHGPDGKALSIPQHFVMVQRSPRKDSAPPKSGKG